MTFIPSPVFMIGLPPYRRRGYGGGGGGSYDEDDRALCIVLATICACLVVLGVVLGTEASGSRKGEDAAWEEAFAAGQAHWEQRPYTYKGRVKYSSVRVLGPGRQLAEAQ